MKINEFIHELRRRKVLSSLSVYAVTSWLIIQIAATTFPYLGIPKSAVTLIIVILLFGLPVVLLGSWFFNIVRDPGDTANAKQKILLPFKSKNLAFYGFFIGIIAIVLIVIAIVLRREKEDIPLFVKGNEKISVATFENDTQDESLQLIGKMAADWISHGIIQNKIAAVIDFETINSYNEIMANKMGMNQVVDFSKILEGGIRQINGSYFKQDSHIIFQCLITKGNDPAKNYAFNNVKVKIGNELAGIEQLKQEILSYLLIDKNHEDQRTLIVPKYEAYDYYLKARESWSKDYDYTIELLQKSIKSDPSFLKAYSSLLTAYYNTQQIEKADSIYSLIENKSVLELKSIEIPEEQRVLFDYLGALLKGENGKAYNAHVKLYEFNPANQWLNVQMMVTALEFVNKPEKVLNVYNRIDDDLFDYKKCEYCITRREHKATADLLLGYKKIAIKNLEDLIEVSNRSRTYEILVKAYLQFGAINKLDLLLERTRKSVILDEDWRYLYYLAACESKLLGKNDLCNKYATEGLKYYKEDVVNNKMTGRILMLNEDYDQAKSYFIKVLKDNPNDLFVHSKLAQIEFKLGNKKASDHHLSILENEKSANSFGTIEYYRAQAYANVDQEIRAIMELEESIRKGVKYSLYKFKNDPDLIPLFNLKDFSALLNYWN